MKRYIAILLVLLTTLTSLNAQNINEDKQQKVKFGVYITNLYDINFAKNQYTVQFWSWFHHNDDSYHPNKTTEIMNAKSFSRSSANEELVNGIHWDTAKIKAKVNQQWDVSHYPFDTQKFSIILEDVDSTSNDLVFIPDTKASKIDPHAIPDGWNIEKFELKNSVNSYNTAFGDPSAMSDVRQDFSRMHVDVYLQRDGWRLFTTNFIGFIVATVLLLIAFVITSIPRAVAEIPQQPRITLIVGALFSAVGSVYGLSAKLPYTTQFTLADSLQITTFTGVALATMGSMASDVLRKNGHPILATRANQVMFGIFIFLSFGLNGYMLSKALV